MSARDYSIMMKRIRKNTTNQKDSFKSKNPPSMSYDTRERPLEQIIETDYHDEHEQYVSASLITDHKNIIDTHSEIINARKNPQITVSGVRMSFSDKDES